MLPYVRVASLSGKEVMAALAGAEARGVRGGAVYDLLHLVAARKAGAAVLLTLDVRNSLALRGRATRASRVPLSGILGKRALISELARAADLMVNGSLSEMPPQCGDPSRPCAWDLSRRRGPHPYLKFDAEGKAYSVYNPAEQQEAIRRAHQNRPGCALDRRAACRIYADGRFYERLVADLNTGPRLARAAFLGDGDFPSFWGSANPVLLHTTGEEEFRSSCVHAFISEGGFMSCFFKHGGTSVLP